MTLTELQGHGYQLGVKLIDHDLIGWYVYHGARNSLARRKVGEGKTQTETEAWDEAIGRATADFIHKRIEGSQKRSIMSPEAAKAWSDELMKELDKQSFMKKFVK